ncbi:MAG: ABC transporter substrate-binding protein [Actinobacteria bacterium]|nr:ABC transporter substrate-binding protein [Actinomycetota bacterium]
MAACLSVVAIAALAGCGTSSSTDSSSTAGTGPTSLEPSQEKVNKSAQALLPADIRKAGTITVATDPSYPPCESIDPESGEIVGFEPDLWNALGAQLGLEVKVEKIQFDGLIPGLQSGRFPIAMECLSDSAEREEIVSFIDFALDGGATITLADNPKGITADPLSLCGLKTAAQVGTDFIESLKVGVNKNCEKHGKPPVDISEFPTNDATLLALYSGRVDFIVQDDFGAGDVAKNAPKPVITFPNPLVEPLYIGVVVNRDDTELRDALYAAMKGVFADGTYKKIMTNWQIPEDAWLKAPGVNLATAKPLPSATAE